LTSTRALEEVRTLHLRRRRGRRLAIGGTLAVALLAAVAWLLRPPAPPKVREVRRITAGLGAALIGGGGGWATVVSDGERAYYVAVRGGKQGLFQVPVAGGDPAPIPVPFTGSPIFGYLRGQSALLTIGRATGEDYTQDGMALWLVPVPAGAPRRVGRLHTWAAGVSPDEKRLAYSSRASLWLADIDGSGARLLVELPSPPASIRWSPDGRRLRFTAMGEGRRLWIWETTIEKPSPRPLWPGQQGDWVEGGRLYVFSRSGGAASFGLSMSASGSDLFAVAEPRWPWERPRPVRLTFGPIRFLSPVASRSGGPLLAWGDIARSELRRLDPRTGRFEPFLDGVSAVYVDFSSDGRWLAWVSYPEGLLWRARADGSDRLQLTAAPLEVHEPRFSPDGRRIVLVGRTPDEPMNSLYVVSADGTDGGRPSLLARPLRDGEACWDPCWTADGQAVLYSHAHPSGVMSASAGVYRVALGGQKPTLEPGAEAFSFPRCSSQGHVLAVDPQGPAWVTHVRWAGRSDWEKAGPLGLSYENWTRDGRRVCGVDTTTSGATGLKCWSFDRRRFEPLASVGDLALLAVANLPGAFLAPDDTPLVIVDRSVRDIYALEWEKP
jgi:hypothetical protein